MVLVIAERVIGTDPNLHIVKVFNEAGWGYSSGLVSAINKCVSNGSDVINMSLGGTGSSTSEKNCIQAAYDAGVAALVWSHHPTSTYDCRLLENAGAHSPEQPLTKNVPRL
jgi:subtilisin family serine protease